MNHEIHDPVLIQTELTFTFGIIISKTITETAKGECTTYEVDLFGHECSGDFAECDVSELPQHMSPCGPYGSYGITAAVERHPGYKWAIEESLIRKAPPELRKCPPAIPAIMVDALAESIVANAKAVAIESPHA